MEKREHVVSKKYVARQFASIGLLLIIYALFTLIIPLVLNIYFQEAAQEIVEDKLMYYGIYFIIILFGTVIPFFLMRKLFKVTLRRFNQSIAASFIDLFVQAIVFFVVCIALTYISNLLFSYMGMEGKLISGIGLSYDDANLTYPLYVFMLIFVTPLLEEYAFRGVLLNVLSRYGKRFALVASSVIFALAHLNFAEMIPAFVMGIQLGKTESVSVEYYHSVGIRDIYAVLYDRGRYQDIGTPFDKVEHGVLEGLLRHPPMPYCRDSFGNQPLHSVAKLVDPGDTVIYNIDLPASCQLTPYRVLQYILFIRGDIRMNRQSVPRRLVDQADVLDTGEGHVQCPRYRCR